MKTATIKQGLRVGLLALLLAAPVLAQAQGPTFQWAVTCGVGGQANTPTVPNRLTVDAQGNTYVTGYFYGAISIGSISITAASYDVFVAKLNPQGTVLWATTAGGASSDTGNCIALDGSGGVYVGGYFSGSGITFGQSSVTLLNSSGSTDAEAYVAKLDAATGQWQWARRAGGTGSDAVQALTINQQGEVCLAGEFSSGAADFGATVLTCAPATSSSYRRDVFVAKLTSTGTWLWAVRGGGIQTGETAASLVADATGYLYLAGTINGTAPFNADFGSSTLVGNINLSLGNGDNDGYVARISANGTWLWAVQGNSAGFNKLEIHDLAIDQQGSLYVGGSYTGILAHVGATMLFNQGKPYVPFPEAPHPITYYYPNAFVARLDAATGTWGWATRAGGLDGAQIRYLVTDTQGRLYVSGYFLNGIGPVSASAVSAAQLDAATGNWRWAGSSVWGALAIDNLNRLYMGSYFEGASATFGPITLSGPGVNYATGVVARLGAGVLATAPATAASGGLQVWPNPGSGSQPVQVAGAAPGAAVQVLDVLGRQVWAARMPATGPMALPASLPAGMYLVRSAGQYQQLIVE